MSLAREDAIFPLPVVIAVQVFEAMLMLLIVGRDLHSFLFPLNLSLFCPFPLNVNAFCPSFSPWMCPEGAQVQLQGERCIPKVLKLSSEVSECKPLMVGSLLTPHLQSYYTAVVLVNLAWLMSAVGGDRHLTLIPKP
jgi:hypothetical protein